MALDTFVAGRYQSSYNAIDTGITTNGFELQQDSSGEEIAETDLYGGSLIDWVFRGGRVYLQMESAAYKAGSVGAFWPWSTLGAPGIIGRLASDVALPEVLTVTPGTPAAVLAAPNTLTGPKALLAPNNPARLLFHSRLRTVPVRLSLLPSYPQSTLVWFITT